MEFVWPLVIVVTVGLLLAGALAVGPRLFTGFRVTRRSFWCPFHGENVRVEFHEAAWDGKLVDVSQCSAFVPSTDVACTKSCLRLVDFPGTR